VYKTTELIALLAAVVFILSSTANAISAFSDLEALDAAKSWPVARGIVTDLSYHCEPAQHSDPYVVEIAYNFSTAEGVPYTGTSIYPGDTDTTRYSYPEIMRAERLYSPGSVVAVYYDPAEPGNCALDLNERDDTRDELIYCMFGVPAGMVLIISLLISRIRTRKAAIRHTDE